VGELRLRLSSGAAGLERCGRRTMIGGAHLSSRRGEGQRRLRAGVSPYGESENRAGAPPAHMLVGPMERDVGLGWSGPTRKVWAGWAKINGEF
jgi:hypothetical protein